MEPTLQVALEAVARACRLAMRVRFPQATSSTLAARSAGVATTTNDARSAESTPVEKPPAVGAESQLAKSDGSPVTGITREQIVQPPYVKSTYLVFFQSPTFPFKLWSIGICVDTFLAMV
jgi:hypothetical protein